MYPAIFNLCTRGEKVGGFGIKRSHSQGAAELYVILTESSSLQIIAEVTLHVSYLCVWYIVQACVVIGLFLTGRNQRLQAARRFTEQF